MKYGLLTNKKWQTVVILSIFIVCAIICRLQYIQDLPLSGDEVGVGVQQAVGKSVYYSTYDKAKIVPLEEYSAMLEYDSSFGISDMCDSLRERGMHPPLYYLFLRYYIMCFGNEMITLRLLSILYSILTIMAAYLLGKELVGRSAGMFFAFTVTFSVFSTKMGVMVRPYPLLSFLSLYSSFVMLKTFSGDNRINKPYSALYIILTTSGLYALTHYVFVVFFQAVFLLAKAIIGPCSLRMMIYIFSMYIVSLLFFAPWIPSLMEQMKILSFSKFYFSTNTGIEHISLHQFFWAIFTNRLPGVIPMFLRQLLCYSFVFFVLAGMYKSINSKQSIFLLAYIVHIVVYYTCEQVKGMNTLLIEKFWFFVMPGIFLYFSIGLTAWKNRKVVYGLTICYGLLFITNLVGDLITEHNFDGPNLKKHVREIEKVAIGSHSLIITNNAKRRFFLTLVHSLKGISGKIELAVISGSDISEFFNRNNFLHFDNIIIFNSSEENTPLFTKTDIDKIQNNIPDKKRLDMFNELPEISVYR